MEIKLITADKLRISLNKQDMESMSIHWERLSHSDESAKNALLYLLDKAKTEAGFNPKGAKLFIEVYPGELEGCVLYVTAMRSGEAPPTGQYACRAPAPAIFEFEDAETLIRGSVQANTLYGSRILQSELYLLGERYRLVVYPLDYSDRLSIYFLCEFGRMVGEGELLRAFTQEHGSELLPQNALETLSEYFTGS